MNNLADPTTENRRLSLVGNSVGLRSTFAPQKEIIEHLLAKVRLTVPGLDKPVDHSEESGRYLLGNHAPESADEYFFKISGDRQDMDFNWGPNVDSSIINESISMIYSIVQELIPLVRDSLNFIDSHRIFEVAFRGNHYQIIHQTFYHGSPFDGLFEQNQRFDNDITYRGIINEGRVCIIRVIGRTSLEEIISTQFQERTLTVRVAMGQLQGFKPEASLTELIVENDRLCSEFVDKKVSPLVISALDKHIESILKKNSR